MGDSASQAGLLLVWNRTTEKSLQVSVRLDSSSDESRGSLALWRCSVERSGRQSVLQAVSAPLCEERIKCSAEKCWSQMYQESHSCQEKGSWLLMEYKENLEDFKHILGEETVLSICWDLSCILSTVATHTSCRIYSCCSHEASFPAVTFCLLYWLMGEKEEREGDNCRKMKCTEQQELLREFPRTVYCLGLKVVWRWENWMWSCAGPFVAPLCNSLIQVHVKGEMHWKPTSKPKKPKNFSLAASLHSNCEGNLLLLDLYCGATWAQFPSGESQDGDTHEVRSGSSSHWQGCRGRGRLQHYNCCSWRLMPQASASFLTTVSTVLTQTVTGEKSVSVTDQTVCLTVSIPSPQLRA